MTAPVTQDNCTLLPCPFCGGPAHTNTRQDEDLWSHNVVEWLGVSCIECGIIFDWPAHANPSTIERWNKRATPPADMEGEVEAAAEAIARVCHPHRAQADGYWEQWVSDSDKDKFRAEARAALSAVSALQRGVPDGWQLVPKEPTPTMLDACTQTPSLRVVAVGFYHAMLAAAPVLADHRGDKK